MAAKFQQIYDQLFEYCRREDFAGYDPFDGLSSRFFQALPFKHISIARLAWLQIVKRSPYDLRRLLRVESGENPKGIALFALAESSQWAARRDTIHLDNLRELIDRLLKHAIAGSTPDSKRTLAFGYNFDWQSRAFFAPRGTPTIVPTAFAARALVEAADQLGGSRYLDEARAICEFILNDLARPHEAADEICFSYTPIDSSVIYNASLLAGETLAAVGAATGDHRLIEMARRSARFVVNGQRDDGAWEYGPKLRHRWVDNFHTAFILLSLDRIDRFSGTDDCSRSIERGMDYWLDHFFLDDGTPKYYDHETYPVDIHSAAAAIAALSELSHRDARALPIAARVAEWTIENMRDDAGYFYYQKRRSGLVKTPFIRWGQAWMAFGLAKLIEASQPR